MTFQEFAASWPASDYKAQGFKALRLSTGLTQSQFAALYGLSRRTVQNWEADPGDPNARPIPDYVFLYLSYIIRQAN